jgi:hypothetical protein
MVEERRVNKGLIQFMEQKETRARAERKPSKISG